jgi:hypothetical protein
LRRPTLVTRRRDGVPEQSERLTLLLDAVPELAQARR